MSDEGEESPHAFGTLNRAFRTFYLPKIIEMAGGKQSAVFHKCIRCGSVIEMEDGFQPVLCDQDQGGCGRHADETRFDLVSKWAPPDRLNDAIREVAIANGLAPEYLTEFAYQSFALSGEMSPELSAEESQASEDASIDLDHTYLVERLMDEFTFVTMTDTQEVYVYGDGVYRPGAESLVGKRIEEMFRARDESAKHHLVNEVVHAIRRRTYRRREEFNPAGKICLENGILDVDTLTVGPHDAEALFTIRLPIAYDPVARCPRFDKFLCETLPDEDSRKVVQEMAGYCFERGQPLQKAFMFVGGGNNGKSTLLGVLKDLLGLENIATETLQRLSDNRFAAANLWGRLANICADVPSTAVRYTGVFKMLTGGDALDGERKFQHAFSFINHAKLIFSCNELPEVSEKTIAFWRRWVVIRFPIDFTGREDRRLPEKLRTELSGILNWSIDGLKTLRKEGDFPRSAGTDSIMEEWRKRADSLYWFITERVTKDRNGWVLKDDLYQAYVAFTEENDVRTRSREHVGRELPNHIPSVRSERRRIDGKMPHGWSGITLFLDEARGPEDSQRTLSVPGVPGVPGYVASGEKRGDDP